MKVIIVGPDGAGKTSLAKYFEKQGFKYVKRDKPKNDREKQDMLNMYIMQANLKGDYVYDRFAYCEAVYGPIMRDKSVITDEMLRFLEKDLQDAIIIHATDTLDNLWNRCQLRGEDYIMDKETLGLIREKYYEVLSKASIPVIEYVIGKSMF